jgi:hypothetical protein
MLDHIWNILGNLAWGLALVPFFLMAKLVDEGEGDIGNIYLKNTTQNANLYLGLYTAPTSEPAEDAVLTGLTEPTGGTYARIALAPADWTKAGSVFTQVQKTFSATGAAWGNCYGYFICTVATGTAGLLIAVEQFSDGPYNVPDGGAVKVTAKMTVS